MIERFSNRVFLAPMAGVTDRAFRELADEFAPGLVFTEMVSAKGLYYNDKNTKTLLEAGDLAVPCSAQVFGHEPEIIAETAIGLTEYGAKYVDLNSGCPAPKITSNGEGAALMKNPPLFARMVRALADNAGVPVSVKLRKGWKDGEVNAVLLAKLAEENGASMITVHGRTAAQHYSGKADWSIIKEVKQSVKIPVVGNGDIMSGADAKRMTEQTGCDAVMLGRGCLGNPWLIREVRSALSGEAYTLPNLEEKMSLALRHVRLIIRHKGEYIGVREARKHMLWYIKGTRRSAEFKNAFSRAASYTEMELIAASLLEVQSEI